MSEILECEKVVKEGFLRKRSGRMHQWLKFNNYIY